MPPPKPKLLVIQFKYLGDVVVATPTLQALRRTFPDWELHVLVSQEAVPLIAHLPWIDRVWGFPRIRGKINARSSLEVIRQLRSERFRVSVDLVGNDRGALASLLIGAPRRIGRVAQSGYYIRRRCYTDPVEDFDLTRNESLRTWAVTSPLGISFPDDLQPEIAADTKWVPAAAEFLGSTQVLCYITASQPKREWPLASWIAFHQRASACGLPIAFTGGNSPREKALLGRIALEHPEIPLLPAPEPLAFFLAVLSRLRVFISPDVGPMHFASGLGVPTISLFGPTSAQRWAPIGSHHRWLQGGLCPCSGHASVCSAARSCISAIVPEAVYEVYRKLLDETEIAGRDQDRLSVR
jgi:ADP-heptose:LPS heptosyltransferase